jgi:BirA family transcriptional regulator, biotin operon repressor / biotin---[acetyl-CoA-carboxylase] ligase
MAKPGHPFIELLSIDSTNIYAMQQVHARLATPGTAYFAYEQYQGKGQRNKRWVSEQGQNLILSVVIRPPHRDPAINFPLSAATALACYDFFSLYAGDETAIKWPNDLYWRDRKAGGILIENAIRGGVWEFAVIGIGININQTSFDPALPNPVSLKQITGKNFDAITLAKELCSCLGTRLDQLEKGSFMLLLEEYNQVLFGKNEDHKFRRDSENFHGRVRSVTEGGELEIENGDLRTFRFGEIEWILDIG